MAEKSDPEKRRDALIGEDACCGNCRFAYPLKLDLKTMLLDCRCAPPATSNVALMDREGNIQAQRSSTHYVARIVHPGHFCGCWQRDPSTVS
ncbi:MAG: hypothetical protein WBR29_03145 [Gammaproteobacteria bacterium]